jgi:branched-chain amino acid aminotransferase
MSFCYIRLLTPQGLVPVDYTAESLADAARFEPDDGVYTVANTLNTFQTLKLDAHLDRMEDSAAREGIYLKLDRRRLKLALRQMIEEAGLGSVRFRVTVGRENPDIFIISLESYKPPSAELISSGARVVTVPNSARHNAAAKTTSWMHQRESIAASLPEGIYDAILLDAEGCLLEGLGSNFYAVLDDELRTAGEGVLRGIAQQIVFEIAPPIVPIRLEATGIEDVPRLTEAFITSSSRGIIPVVEIDGQGLGDGTPGPVTLALRQAYERWVEDHLETLPTGSL